MNKIELFKVLLDSIRELSGFAPYAYEGATEGMIRCKLKSIGEKLIESAEDNGDWVELRTPLTRQK